MSPPSSVCSGAIHIGDPTALVAVVFASAAIFAMPKSSTFSTDVAPVRFASARKMFSGLRSRCTMPAACAAPTA
jgi:hypothetical protein